MANTNIDTFNRRVTDSSSFWKTYSRGRPCVPSSFWHRLAAYHIRHGGGQFLLVHDLGSGPGVHAPALAEHFSFVTLTDPSPASIEAASAVLTRMPDGERYKCQVGRAEDPTKPEDAGKYDTVFLGNSLHWMEIGKSLKNVASSLRDGGTVAAAFFGIPDVTDQQAMEAIVAWLRHGVDLVMESNNSPTFSSAMLAHDSDYDSIDMDPLLWDNITRIKLNRNESSSRGFLCDRFLETYDVDISRRQNADEVVREEDKDWYATTDLAGLREMISSFPLPTTPAAEKKLWDCLNSVYESKPFEVHYGVSIILATKKSGDEFGCR